MFETKINEKKEDILFNIRAKKAKDLFNDKNYSEAIKYDNVNEKIIFNYLINEKIIDYSDQKINTMILGLNKDHLKIFSKKNKYILIKEDQFDVFKLKMGRINRLLYRAALPDIELAAPSIPSGSLDENLFVNALNLAPRIALT